MKFFVHERIPAVIICQEGFMQFSGILKLVTATDICGSLYLKRKRSHIPEIPKFVIYNEEVIERPETWIEWNDDYIRVNILMENELQILNRSICPESLAQG